MYELNNLPPHHARVEFDLLFVFSPSPSLLFPKKRFTIQKLNVIMLCDMVFYKVLIKPLPFKL